MNFLYLVLACGVQQSPQLPKTKKQQPMVETPSTNDGSSSEQVVDEDVLVRYIADDAATRRLGVELDIDSLGGVMHKHVAEGDVCDCVR